MWQSTILTVIVLSDSTVPGYLVTTGTTEMDIGSLISDSSQIVENMQNIMESSTECHKDSTDNTRNSTGGIRYDYSANSDTDRQDGFITPGSTVPSVGSFSKSAVRMVGTS